MIALTQRLHERDETIIALQARDRDLRGHRGPQCRAAMQNQVQ